MHIKDIFYHPSINTTGIKLLCTPIFIPTVAYHFHQVLAFLQNLQNSVNIIFVQNKGEDGIGVFDVFREAKPNANH